MRVKADNGFHLVDAWVRCKGLDRAPKSAWTACKWKVLLGYVAAKPFTSPSSHN
jgi:hypothetical protein